MNLEQHPAVAVFDNYWATTLAFARSLGEQGVPVHLYGKGAARWSRYCSRRLRCPPIEDAQQFLPWLRERVRSGEITRVAPTTDLVAFYTSTLRDQFSPEVQRSIAPLREIEDCLIKTRFCAISAIKGQPILATLAPDSAEGALLAASALGYPVMLKPKSHLVVGFAERGQLVRDSSELQRHYRQYDVVPGQECLAQLYPELRWPLLQRYVPTARGRVYSVSGIKDVDGGVLCACVSFKLAQWPLHVGVSTIQVGSNDKRILDAGLHVINRVLSRGIFEVELLADGDALYAIDLNPRGFGFLELDLARGSNLPWLWYRGTIEKQLPLPNQPASDSISAHHVLLPFTRTRVKTRTSIPLMGHWSDPLPKIIAHLYLLRHPRSLIRSQFAAARALDDVRAPSESWQIPGTTKATDV